MSAPMDVYTLLDSGEGRKLERVGPWLIDRQSSVALWKKRLPASEWRKADAFHHRSESGGGHWEFRKQFPESWVVSYGGLKLKTKLTSFGHLGFFAEQAAQWEWLRTAVAKASSPKILNLFAYTGGSSLSLALAGAEVTHVDAAKGIVDWSKQNAELNAVPDGKLRYIVDDCLAFLKREERRGKKYEGVLLDPPSYGRGPKGEVFKIEENIGELLEAIGKILVPEPLLIHFSSHTPGFSPEVLRNLLADYTSLEGMTFEGSEMVVLEAGASGRPVPSGTYCRLLRP
jgi:23S rRNA (cytosine1962-C5)-methyltransferase